MNDLDEVQSVLVSRLTDFSRYVANKKYTEKKTKELAKDVLISLEEVTGFYEELAK